MIQFLKFDIYFKSILRIISPCTLTPSYLCNVSVATVTMAVNSPEPTLLCVIALCVCLSSLYYQYVPFLDFVVLFVIAVVAVIVVWNYLLGMDWSVVIPLGTIIFLSARGADVDGVSFVRLSPLIHHYCCRAHSRRELPIWKGLVCRNPSGHHYLTPGGRSRRGWNVLCRFSFV